MAQVFYPGDAKAKKLKASSYPWFRPEVVKGIADGYGVPLWLLHALLGGRRQLDPPLAPKGTGWPVVVFSSGVWGCCEMYTQYCRELASSGAIVVAIEHEDASGLYAVDGATGQPIPYSQPPKGCNIAKFRAPQLDRRIVELQRTAAAVAAAVRGDCALEDSPDGAALSQVLRCGDPERLLLAGHSFGSSGALRYFRHCAERNEPTPFKGALLLDLWCEPLEAKDLDFSSNVPIALVLSEMWARGPVNKSGCTRLVEKPGACLAAITVLGTYHQWISESHLFLPAWVLRRIFIMGPADYRQAHEATVNASRLVLGALLDNNRAKGLSERVVELDREVLDLFPLERESAGPTIGG